MDGAEEVRFSISRRLPFSPLAEAPQGITALDAISRSS